MFLHRRYERLDDEDVRLPAIRLQLYAQTVVAEAGNSGRTQRLPESPADGGGRRVVRVAAENDDAVHGTQLGDVVHTGRDGDMDGFVR